MTMQSNVYPKFEAGKTICSQCKKKISAEEGVTGFLTGTGDWYCLKCAESDPVLIQVIVRDLRQSGKWTREHLAAAFWSRYPGRLPCAKHQTYSGEGYPDQLYLVSGVPTCAYCLFTQNPDLYKDFLSDMERKFEPANV